MSVVFVSYRRKSAAGQAQQIADALLESLSREDVFLDTNEPAGAKWWSRIEGANQGSAVFVAVIHSGWLEEMKAGAESGEDDYLRKELALALRTRGLKVLPVVLEGGAPPRKSQLPPDLRALSQWDARGFYAKDRERSLELVREDVEAMAAPTSLIEVVARTVRRHRLRLAVLAAAVLAVVVMGVILFGGTPDKPWIGRTQLADGLGGHRKTERNKLMEQLRGRLPAIWDQTPGTESVVINGEAIAAKGTLDERLIRVAALSTSTDVEEMRSDLQQPVPPSVAAMLARFTISEIELGWFGTPVERFETFRSPEPALPSLAHWIQRYERSEPALDVLLLHFPRVAQAFPAFALPDSLPDERPETATLFDCAVLDLITRLCREQPVLINFWRRFRLDQQDLVQSVARTRITAWCAELLERYVKDVASSFDKAIVAGYVAAGGRYVER